MKNPHLLIIVLSLIILNACGKEKFIEEQIFNSIPVTGNLTGIVVDESQQPIKDAVIEMKEFTTTTDENGVFKFVDAVALTPVLSKAILTASAISFALAFATTSIVLDPNNP